MSYKMNLSSVLSKFNPFGVRKGGHLLAYTNLEEAYFDVISMMWNAFPLGLVDLPLFAHDVQGLRLCDAKRMVGYVEYIKVPFLEKDNPNRVFAISYCLQRLLMTTGCGLDKSAVEAAVNLLDVFFEVNHVAEMLQRGQVVMINYEKYANKESSERVEELQPIKYQNFEF